MKLLVALNMMAMTVQIVDNKSLGEEINLKCPRMVLITAMWSQKWARHVYKGPDVTEWVSLIPELIPVTPSLDSKPS